MRRHLRFPGIAALAALTLAGCQTQAPMTASRADQERWSRYMATANFTLLVAERCGTPAPEIASATRYTHGRLVTLGASMGIPPHVSTPIIRDGHARMMQEPIGQPTAAQCREIQGTVSAWAAGRDA